MKWLLILCCSMSLTALEYYQEPGLNGFKVDIQERDPSLSLNEQGTVVLEIQYPKSASLHSLGYDQEGEHFQWHAEKLHEPYEQSDSFLQTITLHFEPKYLGRHNLLLPSVHFVSGEKAVSLHPPQYMWRVAPPKVFATDKLLPEDPLSLKVQRPVELTSQNKLKVENLPQHKVTPWHPPYKMIMWLFGILVTVFTVYRARHFFKRKVQSERIDPRQRALKQLLELKNQGLPKQGLFEPFYIRLTEIIRIFIEGQFQINAPEQTTQEFLHHLLSFTHFDHLSKRKLEAFLQFADLVKFAKHHPQVVDCDQAQEAAESFIVSSNE